jgi:enoyl-CoA hydratase/carnithine racemase
MLTGDEWGAPEAYRLGLVQEVTRPDPLKGTPGRNKMTARDVMTRDVISVTPDTPVRKIASLFVKHRIGAVPPHFRIGSRTARFFREHGQGPKVRCRIR